MTDKYGISLRWPREYKPTLEAIAAAQRQRGRALASVNTLLYGITGTFIKTRARLLMQPDLNPVKEYGQAFTILHNELGGTEDEQEEG